LRKVLFFLFVTFHVLGQVDSTVICLPCNQIVEDQAFAHLKSTWNQRPIKIVHIGDSHIQIGHFTKQIRDLLGQNSSLRGSGITFPYSLAKSVDGPWVKAKASGVWIGDNLLSSKPKLDIGLTGFAIKTLDSTAFISFQLRDSAPRFNQISVWYTADSLSFTPDLGSNFTLREVVHSGGRMGVAHFVSKSTFSQFDLKLIRKDSIAREFNLHGVELVNSKENLEYHALGVSGAQFIHLIQHAKLWQEQLKLLNPDLLIFSYGTNEAYNGNFDSKNFTKQVSRFFDEIREIVPDVAIVVTSPPDTRSRKRIPPKQADVVESQSKLKSSFYDLNKVMGGFGSFQTWFDHDYFLKDKLHLNKDGYQLQARLFMLALLGQLKPNWDLSPTKSFVYDRVKLLYRKAVVSDSAQNDSIIIRPKEKIVKKVKFHQVKKGDTFFSIAARYHMNVEALIEQNRRHKSKTLQIGDRIRIK